MMRFLACGLFFLALAGCQSKLDYHQRLTVDADQTQKRTVDGPTYDQDVTITTSGEGGTYDVYVCLEAEAERVEKMVNRGENPGGLLASERKTNSATFTVKIPAKTNFVILFVGNSRQARINLSVTGK